MNLGDFHIPYAVPTVLLALALAIKAPTLLRAWRDPDVRATALLLALATAVFVSVTPATIHRINTVTGVPNIAAPWTYSLLTAFCATCLTMIMRWREEPSARRDRRMRLVYLIYSGIIAALWVTFLRADVSRERIYDIDTYYANTPMMREHIVLYLVAHMVSALVAAYMIGTWFSKVSNRWLRAGLVCLQTGYASGLVFDVTKMIAIGARWSGTDWDFLSTQIAPPFALLDAILVAVGFIIPQAGPALQQWQRNRSDYHRLQPLIRVTRPIEPSSARARVRPWAPLDLRVIQRRQQIYDALLRLAEFFDHHLYQQVYETARAGHGETAARGIAGATAIRDAVAAYRQKTPRDTSGEAPLIGPDVTDHLDAISDALRSRPRPGTDGATRTESLSRHV